jgi:hypothetical protein
MPSHVAMPFGGVGHGSQLSPQAATVFGTHCPAQACLPAGHAYPQLVPSHVAAAPGGAVHGPQSVPHDAGDPSDTHAAPHR